MRFASLELVGSIVVEANLRWFEISCARIIVQVVGIYTMADVDSNISTSTMLEREMPWNNAEASWTFMHGYWPSEASLR